jgi:hypothetical protein
MELCLVPQHMVEVVAIDCGFVVRRLSVESMAGYLLHKDLMKRKIWAVVIYLVVGASHVFAATFSTNISDLNIRIPDNNSVGVFKLATLNSGITNITKLRIALRIQESYEVFNGDYYAMLTHNGTAVVLLNRVGRPVNWGSGYDDCGFDVVFDDSSTNGDIHVYKNILGDAYLSPLIGTWQPDGRTNAPRSVLDSDPRTTKLSDFYGKSADGDWILFVADLSSGGTGSLKGWGFEIEGEAAPIIPQIELLTQPTNTTIVAGATASFWIGATSPVQLAYSWLKDGTNLATSERMGSVTNALLTISNAISSDAGLYQVIVSNDSVSATSQVAQLTVLLEPELTQNPEDIVVSKGKKAEFNVSATGTDPLSYQWYYLTTNLIAGATNNSFAINAADRANMGSYSVIITNVAGSVTSSVAQLSLQFNLASSNATPGGIISRNPNKTDYIADTSVELTAIPGNGYFFAGWLGDVTGSNNPATLLMDNDKSVGALFGMLRNLTVEIQGQGHVSSDPNTNNFPDGHPVVLTAHPSNGWQFVEWTGGATGNKNPVSLVMNSNQLVQAVFRQLYQFNVVIIGQGQVVLDPSQTNYLDGATVKATAAAANGYRFMEWSGGVYGTNATETVIVASNTVITATFVPVLGELAPQMVDEESVLSCLVTGTNPAPATFVFSLDPGAPEGAAIATNGLFTWKPTEQQGPSTNAIGVRVADRDYPNLSATNILVVVVNEVNRAPQLVVPPDRVMEALDTLTVTNLATDADWPANTLAFALVSAPAGVQLNTDTGVLTWTPSNAQRGSTNIIVVKVTDNGQPPLSATNQFRVAVKALPAPAPDIVSVARDSAGLVTLRWHSVPGRRYRVETRDRLTGAGWVELRELLAADVLSEMTDSTSTLSERYYRIVLLPES